MRNVITILLTFTLLIIIGCTRQPMFTVEGKVTDAADKTLYLEKRGILKNEIIDSCKLDETGTFRFKQPKPEYPEFYALNLDNQRIFFAIDSTETVTFTAQLKDFPTNYNVEGSESAQKIKELCLLQNETQAEINKLLDQKTPSDSIFQQINALINTYKEKAIKYIITGDISGTKSAVAYFAIFQRINDYLIFDVYDEKDNKIFAAVATGYELAYPDSPRTLHLKNLTLQGRNEIRKAKNPAKIEISELSNIEIELPSITGENIKLSSISGKVVILDFTIYQAEFSPERNLDLRALYNKYKEKGLEIYQISYDPSEHFWKTSASNLPWICVHDGAGIYSPNLRSYNVTELPTSFILNRDGEPVSRKPEIDEELEKEIIKLL